jgi:hypothetical protein
MNIFERIVSGRKEEIPEFTRETGIAQIRDLEALQKFIKFLAPEDFFQVETNLDLKFIEIKALPKYIPQRHESLRIMEENNKLKVETQGVDPKDYEFRLFDLNDISKISKELPFLLSKTIPILEHRLFLQGKASKK